MPCKEAIVKTLQHEQLQLNCLWLFSRSRLD
jgi:hypothetical protein